MAKYAQGKYVVKILASMVETKVPTYRSSWEWAYAILRQSSGVVQWDVKQ